MLKGGKEIQQQYKGFRNAIQKAYPELTFAKWKQKGAIVEEQQRKPAAFASILTWGSAFIQPRQVTVI